MRGGVTRRASRRGGAARDGRGDGTTRVRCVVRVVSLGAFFSLIFDDVLGRAEVESLEKSGRYHLDIFGERY
jgi:hypothetical protein